MAKSKSAAEQTALIQALTEQVKLLQQSVTTLVSNQQVSQVKHEQQSNMVTDAPTPRQEELATVTVAPQGQTVTQYYDSGVGTKPTNIEKHDEKLLSKLVLTAHDTLKDGRPFEVSEIILQTTASGNFSLKSSFMGYQNFMAIKARKGFGNIKTANGWVTYIRKQYIKDVKSACKKAGITLTIREYVPPTPEEAARYASYKARK